MMRSTYVLGSLLWAVANVASAQAADRTEAVPGTVVPQGYVHDYAGDDALRHLPEVLAWYRQESHAADPFMSSSALQALNALQSPHRQNLVLRFTRPLPLGGDDFHAPPQVGASRLVQWCAPENGRLFLYQSVQTWRLAPGQHYEWTLERSLKQVTSNCPTFVINP